jgi:phosphoribosylformylglycinamidine cyclo-ligase
MRLTYKDAGVDRNKAINIKKKIKMLVRKTYSSSVVSDIGKFGGFFSIPSSYNNPILVSSVDGVGTKIKLAIMMNRHDVVGEDIVNHCANDIAVHGARPLFFLDYIAVGKLENNVIEKIMDGLIRGCQRINCSLIGGELAQMHDVYKENEYDIAGFIIGIVEKNKIIDGRNVNKDDFIIGLPSSGLHTNGYSLARKVLLKKYKIDEFIPEINNTLGEELLKPHICYSNTILKLIEKIKIKAIAHITGGGWYENIPRVLPKNLCAIIYKGSWHIPPIFNLIKRLGNVSEKEMFSTFNMGIGLILIVSQKEIVKLQKELDKLNQKYYIIGHIEKNNKESVIFKKFV